MTDGMQMPPIIPCFDDPAGRAVKRAVGDNTQACIGGNETARLFQRQARHITKQTVKYPPMNDQRNRSAGALVQQLIYKPRVAKIMLPMAFTPRNEIIRIIFLQTFKDL